MGNNIKSPITIDGVEYEIDSFDDNQKSLINHIMDLDRKVNSARFLTKMAMFILLMAIYMYSTVMVNKSILLNALKDHQP